MISKSASTKAKKMRTKLTKIQVFSADEIHLADWGKHPQESNIYDQRQYLKRSKHLKRVIDYKLHNVVS